MTAPLIAIVGSYNPTRADELDLKNVDRAPEAGAEIGRELARQGCHIVVYASYSHLLEVDVVRGYVEVKKAQPEPGCIQVHYSTKYDRPTFPEEANNKEMFIFKPDRNPEWEVSFYRSLREVSGLLMLGGGPSSMIAGVVAMGYHKPIVAVASFGGYAGKVWELLPLQQDLLKPEEVDLMMSPWGAELAKLYIEILLRQVQRIADEQQAKLEQASRVENMLRAQLAQKEAEFDREVQTRVEGIQGAENANRQAVMRYAVVSALFLVLALIPWVIALGVKDLPVIWLIIFLVASPLAAGVSGSTIQVAFSALGIGQAAPAGPPRRLNPVITSAAMGLVGGGITMLLYIITQLIAIGDDIQAKHYIRLIPFALGTGFAAGFALDVVARKLREKAESGLGAAYPNTK